MDSLATEVLVLIFSFLPVSEILSCIKVCRRWHEILAGHESLLSNKACVLKCTSKISRAKQLWHMIAKRQPTSVVLRNADPVVLQMLLKHHPTVSDLSVTIQLKDLKKVLRTVCLFKGLRELGVHVKGGSKLTQFGLEWINALPILRKLSLTEIGCVSVDLPRNYRGMVVTGRSNNLSHFTLNYPTELPDKQVLARIVSHLSCFEMKSVSDEKFAALRENFHNLRTVILTACNCSNMEFPVSLIKELRIQGIVRGKLELDKILDLQKVHLSLQQPLPECLLPGTVTEISLRDTVSHDSHWFLGLSINCGNISKLDLKGFTLKNTIAASLGMRYPKITYLNIMGCLSRHEDHMYLIGLLQDAKLLTTLSCDTPYSCKLHDLREVFPHCWISSVDYKNVSVTSQLPPPSNDVIIDFGDDFEENPEV